MEGDNEPTQIGVTSFVDNACPINAVMTYTKVASVLPWIYSTSGVTERV
jgi:secreted trypsin-like serine protease